MLRLRSLGAFTAVGADAPTTMGSIFSGAQMFDDLDVVGRDGDCIPGAVTPLKAALGGIDRLGMLGHIALLECVGNATVNKVPVIVCAPTEAQGRDDAQHLLDIIVGDARLRIDRRQSRVLPRGRDAIGEALILARELPAAQRECFIVAVDSLVDRRRLRSLVSRGAVVGAAGSDGIIPGEAGVALHLTAAGGDELATLVATAGTDDAAELPDPVLGLGVAAAVDLCFRQLGSRSQRTDAIFADAVGPQMRSEELAFARRRKPLEAAIGAKLFLPAMSTGEVGAAAGALALATAAFFAARGVVQEGGLCLFAGEQRWRGAAIVAAPQATRAACSPG